MSGIKQSLIDLVGLQMVQEWERTQHGNILLMTDELRRVPVAAESILYEQRSRAQIGIVDRALLCSVAAVLDGQPVTKATRIFRDADRFVRYVAQRDRKLCPWTASEQEQIVNASLDVVQFVVHDFRHTGMIPKDVAERGVSRCDAQVVATELFADALTAAQYGEQQRPRRVA